MRRALCLVCALALLLGLAGCFGGSGPKASPTPEAEPSASPSPSTRPTATPAPTATPEPTPPAYDPDHALDRDLPKLNAQGLELPIRGATGYAAVEIGLWEVMPTPTPTPTATAAPTATATPAPTPTPVPAATAAPSPAAEPAPASEEPAGTDSPPAEPSAPASETASAPVQTPAETVPVSTPAPTTTAAAPSPSPTPVPTPTPTPDPFEGALAVLDPGTPFTILEEEEGWWRVECGAGTGWVEHRFCMVNLPDVVPSIVYDATNSYSSRYVSSGKPIPGITGEALYQGKVYNPRLGREQYLMPVLYATAKKVCAAQQAALAEGNSLKLYEAFRPRAAQRAVVRALSALAETDPEVKAGITTPPWTMTYFISTGISNHQKGLAVDVSLVRVTRTEARVTGGVSYLLPVEYEEYEMPTPMHELSLASASTTGPGETDLAGSMNEPALALRDYFRQAGMTPLESEWWHFNDYAARTLAGGVTGTGEFEITVCRSAVPW